MSSQIDQNAEIYSASSRISSLIRACDLATPVNHLGRWKIRDVVAHLGGVHRWASRIVRTRSTNGPSFTKSKLDGPDLCKWFDEGVKELLRELNAVPSEDPCPNFNPGSDKTVAWWSRRQMHETTVHAWDIERALGDTCPIEPAVAADGIDEFLDVFVRTRGKQTLAAPLILTTTQPARSWTLTPAKKPGRVDLVPGRSSEVETEMSASPERMLLVLWGRLSFDEVECEVIGDLDVAAGFMAAR